MRRDCRFASLAIVAACSTDPTSAPNARSGGTSSLAKVPAAKLAVSSLVFAPDTIVGGGGTLGFVTLSGAAPAGGAVVSLVSSDTTAARVPATVTIPQGQTAVRFATLSTGSSWTARTPAVTASYNRTSVSTNLYLLPADLAVLRVAPDSITVGGSTRMDVLLNTNAPAGGTYVNLDHDGWSAIAGMPQSVFIPAGSGGVSFTFFGASPGDVRITAALNRTLTPAATNETVLTTWLHVR